MRLARAFLGVAASGNAIYAIGGMVTDASGGTSAVGAVEQYDPNNYWYGWVPRTSMPTTRSNLGVAAATNGKIYAIGGVPAGPYNAGEPLNTVEEYDPSIDSWRTVAPLPDHRADLAAAGGANGKVYVFGGIAYPEYDDAAAYEYDPTADRWTNLPPMPHPREQAAAALGPDGRIYVTGGYRPGGQNASGFVADVDVFDPMNGTWSTIAPMPTPLSLHASVWAGGNLYAIGGGAAGDGTLAYSPMVERYDPATDSWSYDTSMSVGRSGLGAAVLLGDEIYAVGGVNSGTVLSSVEIGWRVPPPGPTPAATPTVAPKPSFTPTTTPTTVVPPTPTATLVPGQEQMAVAYQVNPAHDGDMASGALTFPLAPKWSVSFGQAISYPVIARGKVFVTVRNADSYGTKLYALDGSSGAIAWGPIDLGGSYYWSGAAYDDGRLFVLNGSGILRAFRADDGALLWQKQLPLQYSFSSAPTALQGIVYTAGSGSGGTLYAVDAVDGHVIWTQDLVTGDHTSPALSDDGVFASSACVNVFKFNRWSGDRIWSYTPGCIGGGGRTTVYYGGRLYVRDDGSTSPSHIFDATTGARIGGFGPGPAPAFSGNVGYFLSNGTLSARNLETLADLWTFAGDGTLSSAPLAIGSTVFVGGTSGMLYGLDSLSGRVLWSGNVGSTIPAPDEHNVSSPLTGLNAGEGLLVVPAGGTLIAYAGGGS